MMQRQEWKILLADDDPDDRAIMKDAMDSLEAGNVLCFAENGEQALSILHHGYRPDNRPSLIILDLNMPRMNGTETLRRLKTDERFNKIPVIIFSTSVNPLEKEKCMLLGAHSYITKPVSFKESMDTAKAFLAFCSS
jgi:CheY-like chemotaxis protein